MQGSLRQWELKIFPPASLSKGFAAVSVEQGFWFEGVAQQQGSHQDARPKALSPATQKQMNKCVMEAPASKASEVLCWPGASFLSGFLIPRLTSGFYIQFSSRGNKALDPKGPGPGLRHRVKAKAIRTGMGLGPGKGTTARGTGLCRVFPPLTRFCALSHWIMAPRTLTRCPVLSALEQSPSSEGKDLQ